MKPIKLTMNAFGPFSGTECIDFTPLWDHNVFLITGPTGAGKTTIFDAICFALYGRASGENRQNENFKSDFAPEDVLCSCTLEFELRGKHFCIFRQPPQQKLTSKGTYTTVPGKAELTLPDGAVVTGTGEVNARVGEILGINLMQFKQIVMLAQGEFQRMLEASANEKQEIFRRIFSTQLFDRFAQSLSEKTAAVNERISKQMDAVEVCAAGMDFGGDTALAELAQAKPINVDALLEGGLRLVADDRAALDALKTKFDGVNAQLAKINLPQAEETNRKFVGMDGLRKKMAVLSGRKKYIAEQAARLTSIRSAQQACKAADAVTQLAAQLAEYQKEQAQAQEMLPVCTQKMRNSQALMHEAKAREDIKQTMLEHRSALEKTRETFEKITKNTAELDALSAGLHKLHRNEAILRLLQKRAVLLTQGAELEKRAGQLERLVEIHREAERQREIFMEEKADYLANYSLFLSAQAGILARTLEEGEPCPVCGSRSHPNHAQLSTGVCTQAELDTAAKKLDTLATRLAGLETDLKTCFRQLNYMDDLFDFTENEIGAHQPQVCAAQQETKTELEQLCGQIAAIESEAAQASGKAPDTRFDSEVFVLEEIARVTSRILKTDAEISNKQRQIEDLQEVLAVAGVKDEKQLLVELATANAQIMQIEKQITASTDQFMADKTAYDQLCKTVELVRGKLFTLGNQLNVAQNHFQVELVARRFVSREVFEQYRSQIDQAEEIEETINAYNLACTALSAELGALEVELVGKEVADIEAMRLQSTELAALREALHEQQVALSARMQVNMQALQGMRSRCDGMEALYAQYQDYSELSRLANGNNAQRVSFESYVLGAYFDDIISLANLRLSKMTGARYELKRKVSREKFGGASGLNLEMIDNYSGKARNITTLSGGESFKTSLALALSLADIVQMYAGGVVIDTMFIDEGFGTLDDESLTSAVQTLTSLGEDGRMVGIISHVSELRECIPARIHVSAGKTGSSCAVSV